MRARSRAAGALVVFSVLAAQASELAAKDSYLVIIAGLGGEQSYQERFHEWSIAMREAALNRHGLSEDHVFYLAEDPELAPESVYAESRKENIVDLFQKLAAEVRPGDQLFVLLIGHGSYRSDQSRFNLPGPDLTAADFEALLKPFQEQQVVFVNASSASGSFLPVLSGNNRVVITATKSGFERNETLFGKYFVEAYAGEGADTDKNERVSVLEAFEYARLQVDGYYEEQNLLKTEHAVLDDDGDGEGAHELGDAEGDFASAAYLMGTASAAGLGEGAASDDPELARLVQEQIDLEGRVEALKLQRDSMPEELYLEELERLLLELARVTERIEERQKTESK